MENGKRKREQIDTDTPTTILTQIGVVSCLPKIARTVSYTHLTLTTICSV